MTLSWKEGKILAKRDCSICTKLQSANALWSLREARLKGWTSVSTTCPTYLLKSKTLAVLDFGAQAYRKVGLRGKRRGRHDLARGIFA